MIAEKRKEIPVMQILFAVMATGFVALPFRAAVMEIQVRVMRSQVPMMRT